MTTRTPPIDLLGLTVTVALLGAINVGWTQPQPLFGALFLAGAGGLALRLLLDLGGHNGSQTTRR